MPNIEITPSELELGRLNRGELRDASVRIHDRRPETQVVGHVTTSDDLLRILPATEDGCDVVVILLVRTSRKTPLGPTEVCLHVHANDENHEVAVRFVVIVAS